MSIAVEVPPDEEDLLEHLDAQLEDDSYLEGEDDEEASQVNLDPDDAAFIDKVILSTLVFLEELCKVKLFPYQKEIAYRVIESILINDGETITIEQARQSGKSEVLANVIATLMVLLPRLAKAFPAHFGKFENGFMVGCFAPTEEQADTVWGRIVDRLSSEDATIIMLDPEIDDKVTKGGSAKAKMVVLKKSGSFCRRQTCNPKAKIESKSYHFVLIDECFPAETPVLTTEGWVPIGDIVNGDRRDWIVATQEADGTLGWGHVRTGYRTPRHTPLVRVDHEHGSVYATANHPFMVDGAAVPASALQVGARLSLVPGAPQLTDAVRQEGADALLLQSAQSAVPQSDGRSRCAGEDGGDVAADWAPPQDAGRQWSRDDRATAAALGRAWDGLGGRACVPHWRQAREGGLADALQARSGVALLEAGGGNRRGIAWDAGPAGTGLQQDGVLEESRVVRVEVLEPGSPEFGQFSDGADFVYSLEVDSESHTYVAGGVLVGNCQEADSFVVDKSIGPMMAFYNGSRVYTGTPTRQKNIFYKSIQYNKRRAGRRGVRRNHFSYDYKFVCKYNPNYRKFIAKEKARLGEDSDEFRLSYCCEWLIDQGMYVTEDKLSRLADPSMNAIQYWYKSQVLVGIDPARTKDSTVVTVVWVDWDRPDAFGFFEHRILAWLELHNQEWETQYRHIVEFLDHYNILRIGVDTQGMGSAVYDRIRVLFPEVDVVECPSDPKTQGTRWKHLKTLIERSMLVYPAGAQVRRTRPYKRFVQQMVDLETKFVGPHMLALAPDEAEAHDDYPDSLAIACSLSLVDTIQAIEVIDSPWASRR